MRILMNNCCARRHAELYGTGAFYDLYAQGPHARLARDLTDGDECVVATRVKHGEIEFSWYAFGREEVRVPPDEPGTKARVFFGKLLRSDTMSQAKAVWTEPYSAFFNVLGHFKRQSIIREKMGGRRRR